MPCFAHGGTAFWRRPRRGTNVACFARWIGANGRTSPVCVLSCAVSLLHAPGVGSGLLDLNASRGQFMSGWWTSSASFQHAASGSCFGVDMAHVSCYTAVQHQAWYGHGTPHMAWEWRSLHGMTAWYTDGPSTAQPHGTSTWCDNIADGGPGYRRDDSVAARPHGCTDT